MNALVTGGAGFIGSHIAERLIKDGHKVVIVDDLSAGKKHNIPKGAVFIEGDVSGKFDEYGDIDVLYKYKLKDILPLIDVVFHNAASKKNICLKSPTMDLDVNGKGTLKMLQMCKKAGVKHFIHASTGSVYGEVKGVITEETLCNPVSYYGISKLAGDRYVNMYSKWMRTTILRYFHVYGNRQESDPELGGVVAVFKKQIEEGKPITIHGNGSQVRSFTHVDDIVEANIQAWEKKLVGVYNCASSKYSTINDLVDAIQTSTGRTIISKIEPNLEGDIMEFNIDNSKIKKATGIDFKPLTI